MWQKFMGDLVVLEYLKREVIKVMTKKELQEVRELYPGYVGGATIAKEATDKEMEFLVELKDKIAKLKNRVLAWEKQEKNIHISIIKRLPSWKGDKK